MILFLNFAPLTFMGGAEKWINDTAKKISGKEESYTLSVDPKIANIYGRLVLKRKFDSRASTKSLYNHRPLDFKSFIPFTKKWHEVKKIFSESRAIYTKYEILELLIILYFLGPHGLRKTLAGLHSPFIYSSAKTFFEKLHNLVYGSNLNLKVLSLTKKVHVLNQRDLIFLKQKIDNVVFVPNGIEQNTKIKSSQINSSTLNILFVGELSERKGVDILIEVIKSSPNHFKFTIAGDGPLKNQIIKTAVDFENCTYYGFLSKTQLKTLYQKNDILFLPSRAESMPLSILEAMSYGLIIVDSSDISLNLDKKIEHSLPNKPENYLSILGRIYKKKQNNEIKKQAISNYFQNHFSSKVIYPQLFNKIFNI